MQLLAICIFSILTLDSYLAVPYGFLGVRGKKSLIESPEQYNYDSFEMENPYKLEDEAKFLNYLVKNYGRPNYQRNDQLDDLYEYEKRVPYGFTGVRGKRSPVNVFTHKTTGNKQSGIVKQF